MKYQQFKLLYAEISLSENIEMYIAERGWQEWMNDYTTDEVVKILTNIYSLKDCNVKNLIFLTGLSQAMFAERYDVPLRTVENWATKSRTMTEYVFVTLAFAVFTDLR